MNKVVNIVLVGLIGGFAISCGGESKPATEEATVKETTHEVNEVEAGGENKIWPANLETTQGFHAMAKIMGEFSDKDNVEAYGKLVDDLKVEYRLIFKNCTMTGEAHDHLHHYLMPFSDMFKGLKSDDLATCQASFKEMEAHLADYKNHFK